MKKISSILIIAIAMVFLATSCEKEGVYNPKKKIANVYMEYSDQTEEYYGGAWHMVDGQHIDEYLYQRWEWDGNLLQNITYYNSTGSTIAKEVFKYDGKRLSTVAESSGSYYQFTYAGDQIATINCYEDGELSEKFDVTYDGKHISQMKCTYYYDDSKAKAMPASILHYILPTLDPAEAAKMSARIKTDLEKKESSSFLLKFEWDGNNVSKISYDYGAYYTYSISYQYDSKINPMNNLFDPYEYGYSHFLSKNNVISATQSEDGETCTDNYTYTYSGNYPETMTHSDTDEYSDQRNTYSYKYRYQYK